MKTLRLLAAGSLLLMASMALGAEATNKAAFSVCPDGTTTDLKVGSPTISIVQEGTPTVARATLSVSQATADIGVGCRIDYDSGSKCWIRVVEAPTTFLVTTATGGLPPACSGKTVDAIKHEYASLSAFEAGFTDSSHVNGTNLVTADVRVWACCYDGSSNDTTVVTVDWSGTTDADHNLIIYTPHESDDYVKESQRHKGAWTSNAYALMPTSGNNALEVKEDYTWVEGLEVDYGTSTNGYSGIKVLNTGCRVDSNLVRRSSAATGSCGINATGVGLSGFRVFNNITYGGFAYGFYCYGAENGIDFFNNTTYGSTTYGIYTTFDNSTVAKNNISYSSSATWDFNGTFASASDYNFSKDDTAPGAHSIHGDTDGKTPDFINTASGTEDLHLQSTSDAIDVGTNDPGSGLYDYDIDGQDRAPPWDMSADEYIGAPIAVFQHLYRMMRDSGDSE